jgi:hypothetical protein
MARRDAGIVVAIAVPVAALVRRIAFGIEVEVSVEVVGRHRAARDARRAPPAAVPVADEQHVAREPERAVDLGRRVAVQVEVLLRDGIRCRRWPPRSASSGRPDGST